MLGSPSALKSGALCDVLKYFDIFSASALIDFSSSPLSLSESSAGSPYSCAALSLQRLCSAALPFAVRSNPGALDNGDYVYLPGVRKALLEAADELDAVAVKPDGGLVKFTVKLGAMTDAERRILADGCLINYYKNN
mgnify:CR=1 FL=1